MKLVPSLVQPRWALAQLLHLAKNIRVINKLSNAATTNFTMSTPAEVSIPAEPEDQTKDGNVTKVDDAPANAVSVVPQKKEPPPESAKSIRLRIWVILSFWAIIIIVGLPIWWRTTTIYRARLPLDQMMDWADGRVPSPVINGRAPN